MNTPFVSVTICVPGSIELCQTIDHVVVDTASAGLRIIASVLQGFLSLPPQVDAEGNSLAECVVFADGYSWGAVRLADVQLAGEMASSIPIHVIADQAFPVPPSSCSSYGPVLENTVKSLGANGILGVSAFLEDCGPMCAQGAIPGTYYVCRAGGCQPAVVSLSKQVQNPVARLPTDNNGVIIELPQIPTSGAALVKGSLILGIGTRSNNGLGKAIQYDLDSNGNFSTAFDNRVLAAFIDTGSNALFFPAGSIPVCPLGGVASGFYCPVATQTLTATVQGAKNGMTGSVDFDVTNANSLLVGAPTFTAFSDLAGPFSGRVVFDWGLPFFYGRRVSVAFEQRTTPTGAGPFIAF